MPIGSNAERTHSLGQPELRRLSRLLETLRQGDVIKLGATNILGRGPSPTLDEASPDTDIPSDAVWSLTLISEVGWYVVLTQDCDIVRHIDIEPCLILCPLDAMDLNNWTALRRGPYSPREFPFPPSHVLGLPVGTAPVANLRYVASLEKLALLTPGFQKAAPLPSPLARERFGSWLARRSARAAHPDAVEEHVLKPAGARLRKLAKQYSDKKSRSESLSPVQMLVGAAEEWFIGPTEQLISLNLFITPSSSKEAGLWDAATSNFKAILIDQACTTLKRDLSSRCTNGLGYTVSVEVHTTDKISVERYRGWSEWTWDHDPEWSAIESD
jgi:hypothetical protein